MDDNTDEKTNNDDDIIDFPALFGKQKGRLLAKGNIPILDVLLISFYTIQKCIIPKVCFPNLKKSIFRNWDFFVGISLKTVKEKAYFFSTKKSQNDTKRKITSAFPSCTFYIIKNIFFPEKLMPNKGDPIKAFNQNDNEINVSADEEFKPTDPKRDEDKWKKIGNSWRLGFSKNLPLPLK